MYYQREVCGTGMLESQRALTTSPGMPGALAETPQDFAMLHPKGRGGRQTHKQTPSKTPKPIILPLREMKHEVSPQGMTTEADTHSLSPVLLSYSTSLQTALLQLFKLHSIITPEPFVKPQY